MLNRVYLIRKDGERILLKERYVQIKSEVVREATWKEIHGYRPDKDLNENVKWLVSVGHRLPRVCGCEKHWKKILGENPPRWDDFFAWSVEAHNAVNAKLGKPVITLEQAESIWSKQNAEDNLSA